jgi:hypothetical protein
VPQAPADDLLTQQGPGKRTLGPLRKAASWLCFSAPAVLTAAGWKAGMMRAARGNQGAMCRPQIQHHASLAPFEKLLPHFGSLASLQCSGALCNPHNSNSDTRECPSSHARTLPHAQAAKAG